MSLEHDPSRPAPGIGHNGGPALDAEYWNGLINEKAAAAFLGVTDRTMQKWRQQGGGPEYIALSSRCVRYTRLKCRTHAEARARTSTSDQGKTPTP